MSSPSSAMTRKRAIWGVVAIIVIFGLWYAFRPEKLFINKHVNEAAPVQTQGAATPIYTGRFVGEAHKTSGRATIFKQADGTRSLRLTDFSTSNGPQLHVLLVDGENPEASKDFSLTAVKNVDLGDLKGNQGDQSYSFPGDVDLQKFNTVTIYCERFHANFGSAALQEF
jgi:Electron transfer DM13